MARVSLQHFSLPLSKGWQNMTALNAGDNKRRRISLFAFLFAISIPRPSSSGDRFYFIQKTTFLKRR